MPVTASGIPIIPRNKTQPIVVQLHVPRPPIGSPGNYSGVFRVHGVAGFATPLPFSFTVPVHVEIWPIELPHLNGTGSFTTLFSFQDVMRTFYYPELTQEQLYDAWLPLLSSYRITGDDLSVAPRPCLHPCEERPLWLYEDMASHGATWMNLIDSWSWRGHKPNSSAIVSRLDTWLRTSGLAARPDLLNKMYVYGFDEWPEAEQDSLVELYGAVQAHFPHMRTVATFGWLNVSLDLPLTTWVNHYVDYYRHSWRPQQRLDWVAAGHQYFWYWSDDPWDTRRMNPSWIEWPVIQGRLLFWLASLHGVPGMLYWTTDLWGAQCMPGSAAKISGKCRPLTYDEGLEGTMYTNWYYASNFCAANGQNGDGTLVYPTADGPVASLRLANIRAGIEVRYASLH
jgi:hypothetical protein